MKWNWRSALGYGFILLALALVSVASSLDFNDPGKVLTIDFWLIVGLKTLVSILTFNIIYFNLMLSKKTASKDQSKLAAAFQDYAKYPIAVYKGRSQVEVRRMIEKGNQERFEESANVLLAKITNAIQFKDVMPKDGKAVDLKALIDKVANEHLLTKRERAGLWRVMRKVLNGRVQYDKLDYNHLMLNNDIVKNAHPKMVVNEKSDLFVKNINIAINGAILSLLFTIFALGDVANPFYEIIANGVTIAFAVFNAYVYSTQMERKLINAFMARKDFFAEFMEEPKTDTAAKASMIKNEVQIETPASQPQA